jgi:hypothetical protein
LAVVDCGVAHVIAPDQLVGIRINVILVTVEVLPVLLGPARVLILLPVLGRLLLPLRGVNFLSGSDETIASFICPDSISLVKTIATHGKIYVGFN